MYHRILRLEGRGREGGGKTTTTTTTARARTAHDANNNTKHGIGQPPTHPAVPGGVGPMTVAMLMGNTVKAAEMANA